MAIGQTPPPPTEDGRGCGLGRFDLLVAMVARFRLVPGMGWVGSVLANGACPFGRIRMRARTGAASRLWEEVHTCIKPVTSGKRDKQRRFQVHSSLALAAGAADEAPRGDLMILNLDLHLHQEGRGVSGFSETAKISARESWELDVGERSYGAAEKARKAVIFAIVKCPKAPDQHQHRRQGQQRAEHEVKVDQNRDQNRGKPRLRV